MKLDSFATSSAVQATLGASAGKFPSYFTFRVTREESREAQRSKTQDEGQALQALAVMQQGAVPDLDARLALVSARISLERKLPMADSVILATARAHGATVWTQDADFKGLPGVQFRRHKP